MMFRLTVATRSAEREAGGEFSSVFVGKGGLVIHARRGSIVAHPPPFGDPGTCRSFQPDGVGEKSRHTEPCFGSTIYRSSRFN